MTTVVFSPSVGGNGLVVSDDDNPTTGLANGGHRERFVPALEQTVAVAAETVANAASALTSAQSALTAPGTQATSTTTQTVGLGSKLFTLAQTGKAFVVGQWVSISNTAAPSTQWMWGAITAFNSGTGSMTVNVVQSRGSNTLSSWVITPAPPAVTKNAFDPPTLVTNTAVSAVAWQRYICTNTSNQTTVQLPAGTAGDCIAVDNATGRFDLLIQRNGGVPIQGLSEDMTVDFNGSVTLCYVDATRGWRLA